MSPFILTFLAKIPNPRVAENGQTTTEEPEVPLPQTLVRIPTEHAPALQAQAELAMENESEQGTPTSMS